MRARTIISLLAALALAGAAAAAEPSVEQFLPADSLLAICYYGDNPDLDKTAIAQLAAEPEVAEWLATVRQATAGANQMVAGFLKVNPELLRPLLGSRVGLVVLPPAGGPPAAILAARVGKPGDKAREQVAAFLTQLAGLAGRPGQKVQVAGIEATQVGGQGGPCFGMSGEFLLLGTSQAAFERALAPNTPKLADQATFQRVLKADSSPVALLVYDHAALMGSLGGMIPPPVRAALEALGLNGVKAAGLRLGVKGKALVGSVFIHTRGERTGLVRAIAASPVDRSLLRLAPRDAAFAWLSNIEAIELYDPVVAALEAAMKGENGPGARAAIAEFEKGIGVSFRDGLLGSLGRGCLVTTSSAKSVFPALIISQAAKDGEKFEATVEKLVAALNAFVKAEAGPNAAAELRTIRYGAHTLRYLALPGVPMPIAPCMARHGGRIVFALTPIHMKDYLAFLDANEPSLLDLPGFKELEAQVPKDATSLAYSDFGEGLVGLYSSLGPLLTLVQAIPGNPVPIDLANMPSVRTVRKHMFGAISYSYATEDLIVAETVSPLGVGLIDPVPATALLAVGAGMALPAIASARTQARNVASMNNLRQITMGIMVHANDKGVVPPDLAGLLAGGFLEDPKVLVAPNDPAAPQVGGRPCSYVYFLDVQPGLKLKLEEIENPGQVPMVWERAAFQRGERCVAFADGHIERLGPERFEKLMDQLRAFLKQKALKGKGGEL